MTRTVALSTWLPADPDTVWRHAQTSALLHHVCAPWLAFRPMEGEYPRRWQPGEYRAKLRLVGIVPLGWQAIRISLPEPEGDSRVARDDGYSPLIKRWHHRITVTPQTAGTLYCDQIDIDAGPLTRVVAGFASLLFAHRQRRWRDLAETDFAALG